MRSIRKIAFQNAAGERFGLNGEKNVYAMSLSGLGFTLAPTFADLNRGFYSPVSDESEPQGTTAFTLVFTKKPYEVYKTLVDWLCAAGTVTLVYNPTGKQEYFKDVIINFLQKTELNAMGWLEIPCSFFSRTPWYMPTPAVLDLGTAGEKRSKRYPYRYNAQLKYGVDSSSALSGTIFGAGHIPGAMELTYTGAITNPKIRLVGQISGKTYGVCSLSVMLSASDTLKYSSKYEKSFVKRISASGAETDLLDVLDLSSVPFFHIPVDEPCTVSVEADAPFTGRADLLIYYYYRSV